MVNVLVAGVESFTPLSFERTKNVYSFGPAGSVIFRCLLEVAFQLRSTPSTLVSKVMRPVVSTGLTVPSNSKVTILVSLIFASSAGPFVITVLSTNRGEVFKGACLMVLGLGEAVFGACFSALFSENSWKPDKGISIFLRISPPAEKTKTPIKIRMGIRKIGIDSFIL